MFGERMELSGLLLSGAGGEAFRSQPHSLSEEDVFREDAFAFLLPAAGRAPLGVSSALV